MIEAIKNLINSILAIFSNSKKDATDSTEKAKPTDNPPKPIIKDKPKDNKSKNNETPKPNTNMNKTKKNLYSLIVGINDYQFVTKLGGCVNDANRVNQYFESVTKNSEFEYHPLILTDAKATKKNIEDAFLNHLTQAGENDVVVYYFSGHGAQENSDPVWNRFESDGGLETQVCYDSRDDNGTPDLADKELRYLIHQVSLKNPHIVVISDSCHSGDNTRTDLVKRKLNEEFDEDGNIIASRLSGFSLKRSWDKFCFSDKISKDLVGNAAVLSDVLPQGRHIQMSACKDRELAYEMRGSGIFTSMLLNVLERSEGNISYTDLRQRIRHSITGKFNQVPQIYTSSGDATELQQAFLGGAAVKEPFYYNVQRNFRSSIGWTLDIGAIHGIPTNTDSGLVVEIRDTKDKSIILTTATVKKVLPGMTQLEIADQSKLHSKTQYFATIPKLFTEPLRMYLHGDANGLSILRERIDKDTDFKYSNIEITDDLVLADYLVYAKKGNEKDQYIIGYPINDLSKIDAYYKATLRGDNLELSYPYWKPLTEEQDGFYKGAANEIIKFMKGAANWHFLKKLKNDSTQLKNHGVELIFSHIPKRNFNREKQVRFEDGSLELNLDSGSTPPSTYIKIDIKNNSNRTYRVALPALFPAFEVITGVLTNGVTEIKPGETKQAFGGETAQIPLFDKIYEENNPNPQINEWVKDYNWRSKSWALKLIISTDDFNIDNFARKAMPYPDINRTSASKGFGTIGAPSSPVITSDWTTELFEIEMLNPFYVKPPEDFA